MFNIDIKNKFKAKPKSRVGLDIGSSSIKMAEIESDGDNPALLQMGMKNLPDPSKETLKESIRSLAEELKLTGKEVNVSVSGPSTIVRFISMPKMRDDELKSAIKFEAEKHIPFAIDSCIMDYQVLRKDEKEGKLETLLVAVKKEAVMDRINTAEESGLSVGIVDVDTFAVANSFLKNFSQYDAEKTAALINIGASLTNVSIVRGSTLCFSRDVAIGGSEFTAIISKSLNLDMANAEKIKISPVEKLQDVINCTKSAMHNFLDEVRLSFSYYENQSGRGIDEIYLSGGSSAIAGLEAALQETFESKPILWDPLKFLDMSRLSPSAASSGNINRMFAVAVGLGVR